MFAEPPRTPYDLNFRLFGFPVRVHPFFWLAAALLGANLLEAGIQYLLIWITVMFVSILVHELGHALVFRRFWERLAHRFVDVRRTGGAVCERGARWKQIVVSLAGPVAGFILCGLVYGSTQTLAPGSTREWASRLLSLLRLVLSEPDLGHLQSFARASARWRACIARALRGKWRGRGLQMRSRFRSASRPQWRFIASCVGSRSGRTEVR